MERHQGTEVEGCVLLFGCFSSLIPTFVLLITNGHPTTTTCSAQTEILTVAGGVGLQTGLLEETGTKETTKGRDTLDDLWTETGIGAEIDTKIMNDLAHHAQTAHGGTVSIHEALGDHQNPQTVAATKTDANEVDRVLILVLGLYHQVIQTRTIVEGISTKRTSIRNGVVVGRGRIERRRKRYIPHYSIVPSSLCVAEKEECSI